MMFRRASDFSHKTCILLLSLCSGITLTFGFAPFNNILYVISSISGFIILLNHVARNPGNSALYSLMIGFFFGFGHFASSLYWLIYPIQIAGARLYWLIPVACFLIPALISLFTAIFGYLVIMIVSCLRTALLPYGNIPSSKNFDKNSRLFVAISFGILWTLFEIIRSYLIVPFPWNLLGYTILFDIKVSQIVAIVGVHGATFFMALLGTAIYVRRVSFTIFIFLLFASFHIYGHNKINSVNSEAKDQGRVYLLGVQNNDSMLKQSKGGASVRYDDFLQLLSVTRDNAFQSNAHINARSEKTHSFEGNILVIWPESSYPFMVSENETKMKFLENVIPETAFLILGCNMYDANFNVYNSFVVVDSKGAILQKYYKRVLVPFGEYMPMFDLIKKFIPEAVTALTGLDKSPSVKYRSDERVNISLRYQKDVFKIAPYICFEIIIGPFVFENVTSQTDFIVNITNDGWFNNSIAVHQHFAMARMRAIEYGVPVVRIATTGISAVVDSHGVVVESIDAGKSGVVRHSLAKSSDKRAFYRYVDILQIMILLSASPFSTLVLLNYVIRMNNNNASHSTRFSKNITKI